jgi:outer membrane lipoprotein-sorting protein
MTKIIRALLIVVVVLLGASCTTLKMPIKPTGKSVAGSDLINNSVHWSDTIQTLRLIGNVNFQDDSSRFTMRLAIVQKKPDLLRVEFLPLNSPVSLALLIAKGEQATYVDATESRAFNGKLQELLSYSFLRARLSQSELLSILSGQLFRESLNPETQVFADEATQTFQLLSPKRRWVLNANTFKITHVQLLDEQGKGVELEVSYSTSQDGAMVVVIDLIRAGERLEFKLEKIKENTDISDSLFDIRIPSSYKIYNY